MANHLVNIVIRAKDTATATVDALNAKLRALTGKPQVVTVSAKASPNFMASINKNLASFTGKGVTVPVNVAPGAAGALSKLTSLAANFALPAAGVGLLLTKAGRAIESFAEKAVGDFVKLGLQVENFATVTSSSLEDASRFVRVSQDLGIPIEALITRIARMNKAAATTPGAFKELGAAIERSSGGNLDSVKTFENVLTALDRIPDAGERAKAGTKIFGREWVAMTQLLAASGSDLEDLKQRLADVSDSALFDADKEAKVHALRDGFAAVRDSVKDVGIEFGASVAPGIAEMADAIGEAVQEAEPMAKAFGDATSSMVEDLVPLIEGLGKLLGLLGEIGGSDIVPGVSVKWGDLFHSIEESLPVIGTMMRVKDAEDAVGQSTVVLHGTIAKAATAVNGLNQELQAVVASTDPLSILPDVWETFLSDMRDGTIDTQEAADAQEILAAALGTTSSEIDKIALVELGKRMTASKKATEEATKALDKFAKDFPEKFDQVIASIDGANTALLNMTSTFSEMKFGADAIQSAFDLGNAPIEALGRIQDIDSAIRDLTAFVRDDLKGKIPNIFSAKDVNAKDFLDKIKSLRDPIQKEITNSFSTGGPEAATKTAKLYLDQLFRSLHGKISRGDLAALLGIDSLQAEIKVALEQKSLAEAQAELEILTGVPGADPKYVAEIKLALAAGDISPSTAKLLIARNLKDLDVQVPAKLLKPDTTDAERAADQFQRTHQENPWKVPLALQPTTPDDATLTKAAGDVGNWYTQHQVFANLPTMTVPPTDADKQNTQTTVEDWFGEEQNVVQIPTQIQWPPGNWEDIKKALNGGGSRKVDLGAILGTNDAGGTVGGLGGIAGERRPEIVDGRYIVVGPTYVPPGSRVTSGARTARILRTRGTRGLRRYDSGGVVSSGPQNVNINFNGVGAIGNRYDLMRTIKRGESDMRRLLGARG